MQAWHIFAGFPCRVWADNKEISFTFLAFIGAAVIVLWLVKKRMSVRVFHRLLIGLGVTAGLLLGAWAFAYLYLFCMGKVIFWQ